MHVVRDRIEAADGSGVEPGRDQRIARWDDAPSSGTSGGNTGTSGAVRITYAIIVLSILAIGLVNSLSRAHDAMRGGDAYNLRLPLLWEMSSAVAIAALTPLIYFGVRWMRSARTWWVRAALALGVTLSFSALHIGGMVGLRKLAMAMAGESYTFGISLSELAYEFRKDAVTAFLLCATFWLIARYREKGPLPGSRTTPAVRGMLWLRDGATRIKIDPDDIVWVSSAGNYVEYCLGNGQTHLIRGTLAAEESRLSPLHFVRVHRARLVNLKRVSALELRPSGDFELRLDTGQTVSGSRRYRAAVTSLSAQPGATNANTVFS